MRLTEKADLSPSTYSTSYIGVYQIGLSLAFYMGRPLSSHRRLMTQSNRGSCYLFWGGLTAYCGMCCHRDIWGKLIVSLCDLLIGDGMVEILLKIRVVIYRMFTPILRIDLTPFNNDASLVVKALLDQLKTRGNT